MIRLGSAQHGWGVVVGGRSHLLEAIELRLGKRQGKRLHDLVLKIRISNIVNLGQTLPHALTQRRHVSHGPFPPRTTSRCLHLRRVNFCFVRWIAAPWSLAALARPLLFMMTAEDAREDRGTHPWGT